MIRQATINDKEKWNQFVSNQKSGSFLQSWEWTELLEGQKDKVWRFVIEVEGDWQAVMFCYKSGLKLGQSFIYAPKGPVMKDGVEADKIFSMLMVEIDKLAKEEKALTFQLDPQSNEATWGDMLDNHGFEKSLDDFQPRHTLILDIKDAEEDIQKEMHQKTRYNIRLAEKNGVKIIVDNSRFKDFYELLKKTEERQNITSFGSSYFKEVLKSPFVKLYLAEHKGTVVASTIMVFWNHQATYLFGASDYEFRKLMAPHLLQWQAIRDAKDLDMWSYDFWGAAPEDAKGREAKWAGVTRFKKGFSPDLELTEYIGTYEKNYQPVKLGVYRFVRKIYKR